MSKRKPGKHPLEGLSQQLSEREERRRRRDEAWSEGFWSGLRMIGRAGWSVVVPGLLGTAAGLWIDNRWPSEVPWSVVGLAGGTILGFASVWEWLSREQKSMAKHTKGGGRDDSRT